MTTAADRTRLDFPLARGLTATRGALDGRVVEVLAAGQVAVECRGARLIARVAGGATVAVGDLVHVFDRRPGETWVIPRSGDFYGSEGTVPLADVAAVAPANALLIMAGLGREVASYIPCDVRSVAGSRATVRPLGGVDVAMPVEFAGQAATVSTGPGLIAVETSGRLHVVGTIGASGRVWIVPVNGLPEFSGLPSGTLAIARFDEEAGVLLDAIPVSIGARQYSAVPIECWNPVAGQRFCLVDLSTADESVFGEDEITTGLIIVSVHEGAITGADYPEVGSDWAVDEILLRAESMAAPEDGSEWREVVVLCGCAGGTHPMAARRMFSELGADCGQDSEDVAAWVAGWEARNKTALTCVIDGVRHVVGGVSARTTLDLGTDATPLGDKIACPATITGRVDRNYEFATYTTTIPTVVTTCGYESLNPRPSNAECDPDEVYNTQIRCYGITLADPSQASTTVDTTNETLSSTDFAIALDERGRPEPDQAVEVEDGWTDVVEEGYPLDDAPALDLGFNPNYCIIQGGVLVAQGGCDSVIVKGPILTIVSDGIVSTEDNTETFVTNDTYGVTDPLDSHEPGEDKVCVATVCAAIYIAEDAPYMYASFYKRIVISVVIGETGDEEDFSGIGGPGQPAEMPAVGSPLTTHWIPLGHFVLRGNQPRDPITDDDIFDADMSLYYPSGFEPIAGLHFVDPDWPAPPDASDDVEVSIPSDLEIAEISLNPSLTPSYPPIEYTSMTRESEENAITTDGVDLDALAVVTAKKAGSSDGTFRFWLEP